jgi:hypothetical protein
MPAPKEFVDMAIGMVDKSLIPAQGPAATAQPAARRRAAAGAMQIPENVAKIKDPIAKVSAGSLGASIDQMFGKVPTPFELQERVSEAVSVPTVADFIRAEEEAAGEVELVSQEQIDENATALKNEFAKSLTETPAKKETIEEHKDIDELKDEAEDESLKALERVLLGLK